MPIVLYDEGVTDKLSIAEVARYLEGKLKGIEVKVRGNPFACGLPQNRISDYATRIASIKVRDANRKVLSDQKPLYGEIEYERKRILGQTRAFGVPYDGFHLQRIFRGLLLREELGSDFVHIVFTNRLFVTWDENERRYHARTSVYGTPSIISTTGIVEAPAKPREYYLLKQHYERLGMDVAELKHRFKGSFIDYEDDRLPEVTKGYAMQAVFYSLIGDPFCQDKGCRLYNAHWQGELIYAQLESGYEFCSRHAEILATPGLFPGDMPVAESS